MEPSQEVRALLYLLARAIEQLDLEIELETKPAAVRVRGVEKLTEARRKELEECLRRAAILLEALGFVTELRIGRVASLKWWRRATPFP